MSRTASLTRMLLRTRRDRRRRRRALSALAAVLGFTAAARDASQSLRLRLHDWALSHRVTSYGVMRNPPWSRCRCDVDNGRHEAYG